MQGLPQSREGGGEGEAARSCRDKFLGSAFGNCLARHASAVFAQDSRAAATAIATHTHHGPLRLPGSPRAPDGKGPLRRQAQPRPAPVVRRRRQHPAQRDARTPRPPRPQSPTCAESEQAVQAPAHHIRRRQAAIRLLWRPSVGAREAQVDSRGQRKRCEAIRLEQDCAAGEAAGRREVRAAPWLSPSTRG
jgi:hypothetical protein